MNVKESTNTRLHDWALFNRQIRRKNSSGVKDMRSFWNSLLVVLSMAIRCGSTGVRFLYSMLAALLRNRQLFPISLFLPHLSWFYLLWDQMAGGLSDIWAWTPMHSIFCCLASIASICHSIYHRT